MKTKTILKRSFIIFAIIAALSFALSVYFAFGLRSVNGAEFVNNPFLTEYSYNDEIDMPAETEVLYGGNTYKTKGGYIKFPNEKVYSAGKYTLNSYGNYSVIYEFDAEGNTYSVEHSFTVTANSYSVGQNSKLETGTLNIDFGENVSGLKASLASGEAFTYNEPINIYNGGITELISFNFMSLTTNVSNAVIRLTDCYDSSVYVDIQYEKPADEETYLLVGAYGKTGYGVWNNANATQTVKTVKINGEECKINERGNMIPSNRKLERHPTAITRDRYNNISLSVDASNQDRLRFYVTTSPEKVVNSIISELNNPDIYGYEFEGFTTGEVFLSVIAKSVTGADYGELEIASLVGKKGEDLKPSLINDTKKPQLNIAAASRNLNVMAGVEMTLPEAVAYDASGLSGEPERLVYYGYGTAFERSIEIKDGKFTPTYLGVYTVIYSVSDVFGNETVEKLELNAVKSGTEGIEFSFDKIENVAAGQTVSFGNFRAKSLNSDLTVIITVTDPTGKETVLEEGNRTMLLERSGKYGVKYSYYDGFYSGEKYYEFDCANKGVYRIEADKVYMPDYVIKGAEYSTEDVRAYKYGAGEPERTEIKGYISYDGGAFKAFNADKFVVEAASTLKIRLACALDESVFIESDDIKIVDVNYGTSELDIAKYFAGDFAGNASVDTPNFVSYNLVKTNFGKIEFINPLLLSSAGFEFSLSQDAKVGAFTVVLTDFYNRENAIRIKFDNGVTVNGKELSVKESYLGTSVKISYDSSEVLTVGSSSVTVESGFSSDKMLLSVEFENVTEGGSFNVHSVSGQSFNAYIKTDTISPKIYVKPLDKVAVIGDEITLEKPSFCDVLSPSSRLNCTVSVYRDGETISDINGTPLKDVYAFDDYTFKIDAYGTYLLVYKYVDGVGRKNDNRATISVIDVVAPTITLNGYNGKPVKANAGDVLYPLSYTVTDNVSAKEAIDVLIVVYNEKGVRVCVSRESFVISKAGNYTVYICCFDEAGNSSYVGYELNVK